MMKVLEKGTDYTSEVEPGSGLLWLPYKHIQEVISRVIQDDSTDAFIELENLAKKAKQDFVNALQYKGKSNGDREILKKAAAEGIYIKGSDARQVVHQQLLNETFLLSDIFEINEFLALDLLVTAGTIKDEHPGWSRGLVAVMLYYEGRLCVIQSVTAMITAIPGRTWAQESCFPRVDEIFKNMLSYIFKNNVVDTMLELLDKFNVKTQLESLDNNLALGDWRHRLEINRLVNGIQDGMAYIIFAFAAQNNLAWGQVLRILEHLKTNVKLEDSSKLNKAQSLLMAAVITSCAGQLSSANYNQTFANELRKYCKDYEQRTPEQNGFKCPEVLELFRLLLQTLTAKAASERNITPVPSNLSTATSQKEEEDFSLKKDVFAFLRDRLFCDPALYTFDLNVMKLYHQLFIDFVIFMPNKVKEMKNRSDDAARTFVLYKTQGIHSRPVTLPQDYENFLECLGEFYRNDEFHLSEAYFDADVKYLPLTRFCKATLTDLTPKYIQTTKFIRGVAKGAPDSVFEMMKVPGHNYSLDFFFDTLAQYLAHFIAGRAGELDHDTSAFVREMFHHVVYEYDERYRMNPADVQGLCHYLDLLQTVCQNNDIKNFFTHQHMPWIRLLLQTARARAVARDLRARMLSTVASMVCEYSGAEVVNNLWEAFYAVRFIGHSNHDLIDFKSELEEHESRLEQYPLMIAFLELLNSLLDARFKKNESDDFDAIGNLDNGSFDVYVSFVREAIFLKAGFRSYKNLEQRWTIATLAMDIFSKLLDYVPQLMMQLLCGAPILRHVLATLTDCVRIRENIVENVEVVEKCSYSCLNLLCRALQRQSYFLHKKEVTSMKQEAVIVGIQEFLMKITPDTGRPEHIISILKFIDSMYPSGHNRIALDIIALVLTDREDIDCHLYAAIISDHSLVAVLRQMFVNILDESSSLNDLRKSVLQIIRVSVVHSMPNFASLLLGVDKRINFQNAGVPGSSRTVLHALLDNAATLPDAFSTLLIMIRDPRLSSSLMRYLKATYFFSNFIRANFPSPVMDMQDLGYCLKCVALELKMNPMPSTLLSTIIGDSNSNFQDILNMLDINFEQMEIPELEFIDQESVMQAMKSCEYFDPKLKIRVVRVDMLENLLKEEIVKLEKSSVLKSRHAIYAEAKQVVRFASEFNSYRWKEASKMIMLDGWRQCLEVLVLNKEMLKAAGVDFVTTILRLFLFKVVGAVTRTEYFARLSSETVLTLCTVMSTFKDQVNYTTRSLVLSHLCKWVSEETSTGVRSTLYAGLLHIVRTFPTTTSSNVLLSISKSFALILDNVCKDSCQSKEVGRIQAMYLLGEMIRLTAQRGLGGDEFGTSFQASNTSRRYLESSRPGSPRLSTSGVQSPSSGMMGVASFLQNTTTITPTPSQKQIMSFASPSASPSLSMHQSKLQAPSGVQGSMDSMLGNVNVVGYILAKGFIANVVDAIMTVDDGQLIKIFSSQPLAETLNKYYVFESKISLLCRVAGTGPRSLLFLMDTNVVPKLADMRVLQIQYFQDDCAPSDILSTSHSIVPGQASLLTRKHVMDYLYTDVLRLLHVMVDASPRNSALLQQIWHFLTAHDLPLSSLVNREIDEKNDMNTGTGLLLALLAKIEKHLPMTAFTGPCNIMSRTVDVVRQQAIRPNLSDYSLAVLREIFMVFFNYCHNTDSLRDSKQRGITRPIRVLFSQKLDHGLREGSPDVQTSLGVIMKIVCDLASFLLQTNVTNFSGSVINKNKFDTATAILEIGLSLTCDHIDMFLNSDSFTRTSQEFSTDVLPIVENKLVKVVSDAAKVLENASFIETILLRTRRLVLSLSPKK